MQKLRFLLLPLAWIYFLFFQLREFLYWLKILKAKSFSIPLIGIGNLEIGGTGKTPIAEYVLNLLLENGYNVGYLSRGYMRSTQGFVLAYEESNADMLGDEAFQVFNKFKHRNVQVAVSEDRSIGIEKMLENNSLDVIILDDAYQHRTVKIKFHILLSRFKRPFYKDFMLPAGNLRQPRLSSKKADLLIFTKSPQNLDLYEKKLMTTKSQKGPGQKVIFSYIEYSDIILANNRKHFLDEKDDVLLVTSIAQPQPLIDYLKPKVSIVSHMNYSDHYKFTQKEVEKIVNAYNKNLSTYKIMLCTEKDWSKLRKWKDFFETNGIKVGYLPIVFGFDPKDKSHFENSILEYVKSAQTEYRLFNSTH